MLSVIRTNAIKNWEWHCLLSFQVETFVFMNSKTLLQWSEYSEQSQSSILPSDCFQHDCRGTIIVQIVCDDVKFIKKLLVSTLWFYALFFLLFPKVHLHFFSGSSQRPRGVDARNSQWPADPWTLDVLHLQRRLVAVEFELRSFCCGHVCDWLHHRPWWPSPWQCDGRFVQWRDCAHRL